MIRKKLKDLLFNPFDVHTKIQSGRSMEPFKLLEQFNVLEC